MYSAGDPSTRPDNTVGVLRNYVIRPNRFDCRAPFVYDSLGSVAGFAIWQDTTNELTVTQAWQDSDSKLYPKNTNGVGYGAGISGLNSSRMQTGYANFLGKLYIAACNAGTDAPAAIYVFDGATISSTPFNVGLLARTVTAYNSRLFLGAPVLKIQNQLTQSYCYDLKTNWTATSCGITSFTDPAGAVINRITPTATTGAQAVSPTSGVTASSTDVAVVYRQDFRNISASYDVPVTIDVLMVGPTWSAGAKALGLVIVDSNNNLQRVTTAGTVGGGAPVWATTVGATTADNTVTWTMDGTNVLGLTETVISRASTSNIEWAAVYCSAPLPLAQTSAMSLSCRIRFGTTAIPTITLTPLDVSLKDGLADTSLAKRNRGAQLTKGDYLYPFWNIESGAIGATATQNLNAVVWSDIGNPKRFAAASTFPLEDIPGAVTAATVSRGRLVMFKRRGMYIFKGTPDFNEPILPETPAIAVGCLWNTALDVSREDEMFWIGEQHVYRMKVGADNAPMEIDTPGMFEEIFTRGSTWVEAIGLGRRPLLAIDHANKDVWVHTQQGKIYVYSLQSQMWSYFDFNGGADGSFVNALIFDPVSNRMLVCISNQNATRFDETSDAQDSYAGVSTFYNIVSDIVPKPFELFAPRYEATLLEIGLYHTATIQNGTLTLSYSFDRGSNYTVPSGYPVSTWLTNPRIRLPLAATGPSVTIKLSRTGAGGARNWSVSKADALLKVHRGELPVVNAT